MPSFARLFQNEIITKTLYCNKFAIHNTIDIVEVIGSSPTNPTTAKPPDCRVAFLLGFSRVGGLSYHCGTGRKAEGFAGKTPVFLTLLQGFGPFVTDFVTYLPLLGPASPGISGVCGLGLCHRKCHMAGLFSVIFSTAYRCFITPSCRVLA